MNMRRHRMTPDTASARALPQGEHFCKAMCIGTSSLGHQKKLPRMNRARRQLRQNDKSTGVGPSRKGPVPPGVFTHVEASAPPTGSINLRHSCSKRHNNNTRPRLTVGTPADSPITVEQRYGGLEIGVEPLHHSVVTLSGRRTIAWRLSL